MRKDEYDAAKGEESVWDYPRPPQLEQVDEVVRIFHNGVKIVETKSAYRVLETSHPPVFYIPRSAIDSQFLVESDRQTYCEYKGIAKYFSLSIGSVNVENAGWYYPNPVKEFEEITNHLAFYPSKLDRCEVGEEIVQAQEGDFYGGWITSKIKGPFKGGAGTFGW